MASRTPPAIATFILFHQFAGPGKFHKVLKGGKFQLDVVYLEGRQKKKSHPFGWDCPEAFRGLWG